MRFLLLMGFSLLSIWPASATPTTPDAFIAALKSAIAAKSADQLLALTCTAGMNEGDKKQTALMDQILLFAHPVTKISLAPLPDNFWTVAIANGKKYEMTAPPKGQVLIQFVNESGNGSNSALLPYALIDGNYFLTGGKTTDLGWKGPPDKTLSFMVMGQGTNGIKVDAKWNASGVEQERTFTSGSSGFMGQYFESVTVVCSDPSANLTLTLMANGKDIVPSLTGKGTITYKK
jgi:hypothetical protein